MAQLGRFTRREAFFAPPQVHASLAAAFSSRFAITFQ